MAIVRRISTDIESPHVKNYKIIFSQVFEAFFSTNSWVKSSQAVEDEGISPEMLSMRQRSTNLEASRIRSSPTVMNGRACKGDRQMYRDGGSKVGCSQVTHEREIHGKDAWEFTGGRSSEQGQEMKGWGWVSGVG
ncbi:hypothetical protein ACLOJK_037788 [Asimina triloba]